MKRKLEVRIILLLYISVASPVIAQQKNALQPVFGATGNCEDAKARLDGVAIEVGKEGFVILIARPGDGEISQKANRQRFYYILRF